MEAPLVTSPDVWKAVNTNTLLPLTDQIQAVCKNTTPETAMAALLTALSFTIADHFPVQEWGKLSYDVTLHLQHTLIVELGLKAKDAAEVPPLAVEDAAPAAAPIVEPEPPTTLQPKFTAGVGVLPGGTTHG